MQSKDLPAASDPSLDYHSDETQIIRGKTVRNLGVCVLVCMLGSQQGNTVESQNTRRGRGRHACQVKPNLRISIDTHGGGSNITGVSPVQLVDCRLQLGWKEWRGSVAVPATAAPHKHQPKVSRAGCSVSCNQQVARLAVLAIN